MQLSSDAVIKYATRQQTRPSASSSNQGIIGADQVDSWHNFKALALLDLYDLSAEKSAQERQRIQFEGRTYSTDHLESRIGTPVNKGFSKLFGAKNRSNLQLSCDIYFESNGQQRAVFSCNAIPNSCVFYREFGSMRFINTTVWFKAKLHHAHESEQANNLVTGGYQFAGLNYKFVGGKGNDSKSMKIKDCIKFDAWFFAERNFPDGEDMPVQSLRNWLGNFGDQTDLKVNSRLALGFSPSEPRFSLLDENITVIEDITNQGGKIMTDGCGYIAADLAMKINDSDDEVQVLPLIIQMRLVCHKGLFKGCLLVTEDKVLCRPGCVVFRESMRKAKGAVRFKVLAAKPVCMDVLNTFETPQGKGSGPVYSLLNRQIVVLLVARGLPKEYLLNLVEEEIKGTLVDVKDNSTGRKRAYKLVRQNTPHASSFTVKAAMGSETEDLAVPSSSLKSLGAARTLTGRSTVQVSAMNRVAEQTYDFLFAGHRLDEPRLRQLIATLILQNLKHVQENCQIPLVNSVNLIGAYDPTGSLKEGEVFVCINNGTKGGVIEVGTVLVMRNPCLHPGDIRKVEAVSTEEMKKFVRNTRGGVIFFSTVGIRSTADMISSGDFDGDKYKVIYNRDLVKLTNIDCAPYSPCEESGDNTPSSFQHPNYSSLSSSSSSSTTSSSSFPVIESSTSSEVWNQVRGPSSPQQLELGPQTRVGPFTSNRTSSVTPSQSHTLSAFTAPINSYNQTYSNSSSHDAVHTNNYRSQNPGYPTLEDTSELDHQLSTFVIPSSSSSYNAIQRQVAAGLSPPRYRSSGHFDEPPNKPTKPPSQSGTYCPQYPSVTTPRSGRDSNSTHSSTAATTPNITSSKYTNATFNYYHNTTCDNITANNYVSSASPLVSSAAPLVSPCPAPSLEKVPDPNLDPWDDPRGYNIFLGLLRTAKENAVGTYNNACLVYQDSCLYGPYSPEALRCGEMFSIAMDSHKTGQYARDQTHVLDKNKLPKTPFYLEKNDDKRLGDREYLRSKCAQSLVLGHIYATVDQYVQKVRAESCVGFKVELDPDIRVANQDQGNYLAEWAAHIKEYKSLKGKVIDKSSSPSPPPSSSVGFSMTDGHQSKIAKYGDDEKAEFERIDGRYRRLFEASVSRMAEKMLSGSAFRCDVPYINEGVRDHVRLLCRRHIATTIYEVTYAVELNKKSDWKTSVNFCWDVCAPELHAMKKENMLRKNGQNKNDLILDEQRAFF